MKTVFLSSSAWFTERRQCLNLIERIMAAGSDKPDTVILDAATVRRERSSEPVTESTRIVELDLRAWVNESHVEGGVVNVEAVRRAVAGIAPDEVVAINAAGFATSTIERTLPQLRIGFYALLEWPSGLVLIGDDSQLHQLSPLLGNAFYIQPSIRTKAQVDLLVRKISHEAGLLRLFGYRAGFSKRLGVRLADWLFSRSTQKREKQLGWVWEE